MGVSHTRNQPWLTTSSIVPRYAPIVAWAMIPMGVDGRRRSFFDKVSRIEIGAFPYLFGGISLGSRERVAMHITFSNGFFKSSNDQVIFHDNSREPTARAASSL